MGELDVSVWEARLGCYSQSWAAAAGAAGGARGGPPWRGWKVRCRAMRPRGSSGSGRQRPRLPGRERPDSTAPRSPRPPMPGPERWPRAASGARSAAFPRGREPLVLSPARPSHHYRVLPDPRVSFGESASLVRFYYLCKVYSRLMFARSGSPAPAGPPGLAPPPASSRHTPWAFLGSLPSISAASWSEGCQSISKEVSLASSTPRTIAPAWWFIHEDWLGKSQLWFLIFSFSWWCNHGFRFCFVPTSFTFSPFSSILILSEDNIRLKTKGGKKTKNQPSSGSNSFKIKKDSVHLW